MINGAARHLHLWTISNWLKTNLVRSQTLASADHNALVASGNPTYARLLQIHSDLSVRCQTLQEAYYMLATSIPQIFQFIPNPLQIEIPPDSNSLPHIKHHLSSPSLSQDDFPSVAFWNRADFTQSDSDLTSISDDKSSLSSLSFLEHTNGERFDTAEIDSVRGHIQAAFITLLDRGLAPTTWSHASSVAVNWLRTEMLIYSPDLGLCSGNWKINMMATIVYSQWSRRRREQIASQVKVPVAVKTTTGGKRKSQEESDSSIAPKKSKITASSHNSHRRPNPSAVARTRTNQTAKKTTTLDPKVKKNAVVVTKSRPLPRRAHTPHPSHSPTHIPLSLRDSSSRSSPIDADDDIELALEEDQRAASVPAHAPTALVSPRTNPKRRITIVNPLDGLFGETPVPPVSRLKPSPDTSAPPPPPPSAPPPLPSSTEPAPSQPLPEPAPASSSATLTSPTQSVSFSASTPAPPAQVVAVSDSSAGDAPAVTRKPLKPYRPGAADTARNLFAREHMQKNPKHTTPEVKEAYNALDNKAKKVYEDEAKRLKQLKKAADKPDISGDADRVNIQRKDSCTSQLGCVGPKRKLPALASHHHSRRSPPLPAGSIMGICKPKDLKHGDEVLRYGGISTSLPGLKAKLLEAHPTESWTSKTCMMLSSTICWPYKGICRQVGLMHMRDMELRQGKKDSEVNITHHALFIDTRGVRNLNLVRISKPRMGAASSRAEHKMSTNEQAHFAAQMCSDVLDFEWAHLSRLGHTPA
ncbi:hypothetical protein B0H13DRAFT_2554191 [Mycena leptocephala]|nr:hypothetical protein B0H13DRAFT_2554191 [Mycena leptocephala]